MFSTISNSRKLFLPLVQRNIWRSQHFPEPQSWGAQKELESWKGLPNRNWDRRRYSALPRSSRSLRDQHCWRHSSRAGRGGEPLFPFPPFHLLLVPPFGQGIWKCSLQGWVPTIQSGAGGGRRKNKQASRQKTGRPTYLNLCYILSIISVFIAGKESTLAQ